MKHQKQAVILPPKIYHYEPKIFGFKISGKRGSKAFDPPKGNIKYNIDTMTGVDKEKLKEPRTNRFAAGPFSGEIQSQTQKQLNTNFFVTETKDAEMIIAESKLGKGNQQEEGSKKKKKKGGK